MDQNKNKKPDYEKLLLILSIVVAILEIVDNVIDIVIKLVH